MAGRFWIASVMVLVAAIIMGLNLGYFVASPQHFVPRTSATVVSPVDTEAPLSVSAMAEDEEPKARLHCIGCGPTLAERNRAVELEGSNADGEIDRSASPVIRDDLAQEHGSEPQPASPIADGAPFASATAMKSAAAEEGSP